MSQNNNNGARVATTHRCTRYCQTEYQFGNVYRCLNTGDFHICDYNCDQCYPLGDSQYICAVSGKLYSKGLDLMTECSPPSKKRLCSDCLTERQVKRGNLNMQ